MKTFYELFNLSPEASPDQIQAAAARQRQELESRPVLDGAGKALLNRIKAAERVLLNPTLRSKYDSSLPTATIASSFQGLFNSAPPTPVAPLSPVQNYPGATNQATQTSASSTPSRDQPTCGVCGTLLSKGTKSCPVCGTECDAMAQDSAPSTPNRTSAANTSGRSMALGDVNPQTSSAYETLFRMLGWSYLQGTIVSADPPYQAEKEFILWKFLLKVAILGAIGYLLYLWADAHLMMIIIVGIIILVIGFMTGLLATLITQTVTIMLSFKNKKDNQVQVRDVRLRDEQRQEFIVRFRGELRSGQANVGDTIEIWGKNRGGTIMARWGYNFRTSSRIWVKYQ